MTVIVDAASQVAAGCICELQEKLLPVVKEQGLLPDLARALTAAAGEQKSHSLGLDAEQGRSTWFPLNDTFVVDMYLALKVLQRLAMDEVRRIFVAQTQPARLPLSAPWFAGP